MTGVLLRLYRALTLSLYQSQSLFIAGAMFTLGFAFLFGMATLHLGNYTVRHWVWRAPAFAMIEAATETIVSLGLIAMHREPMGSARATFADWPAMALSTFFWRVSTVLAFSLVLAGVVQLVRYLLLRRGHRAHTLDAVHQDAAVHARAKDEGQG